MLTNKGGGRRDVVAVKPIGTGLTRMRQENIV